MSTQLFIGTAGWAVPAKHRASFPAEGSVLERYAACFNAAEINSSFYRPHKPETYARWAASVPRDFRFSVKMPKAITHEARLCKCNVQLESFIREVIGLGEKLGAILIQLPPKFDYDEGIASEFFDALRALYRGAVVLEPRHASWFEPSVDVLLDRVEIARVAADPAKVPAASEPGGWAGLRYYRLHGSPRAYFSSYGELYLSQLAEQIAADPTPGWVIFDNTGSGAAVDNGLALSARLGRAPCVRLRVEPTTRRAIARPRRMPRARAA